MTHSRAATIGGTAPAKPHRTQYFVTGLLTVIPLGVTVFILYWLVKFLAGIGRYPLELVQSVLDQNLRLSPEVLGFVNSAWFQDFVGVVLVLVLLYAVGFMTSNLIGRQFLRFFEWFVTKIPLVKTIYGAMKKLVDLVSQDPSGGEVQRVVLIEFPSPEMKTVGLVTRIFEDATTGRQLAAVYVPTTPNPTSGYLEIVPVDRIVSTDWTFDQAMAFIVSGGATAPEKMHYEQSAPKAGQFPPVSLKETAPVDWRMTQTGTPRAPINDFDLADRGEPSSEPAVTAPPSLASDSVVR